jgi:hypothetical protein
VWHPFRREAQNPPDPTTAAKEAGE